MTTQNCNRCKCPVVWDRLIEKTFTKKDGTQGHGWWREDLSKSEHTRERCEKFLATSEFATTSQLPTTTKTEQKADYGKIPDWLLIDAPSIKEAWRGYASISAELVDECQPNLDTRTRAMAVSAVISQIVQMQTIKALKGAQN